MMLREKVRDDDWYRRAAELEDEFPFFSVGPPNMLRSLTALKALEMTDGKKNLKAMRKIARRTATNKSCRTRMRTFIRKVEDALTSGDFSVADTALKSAESEIMRAVSKGLIHPNTGSMKASRLARRVNALKS